MMLIKFQLTPLEWENRKDFGSPLEWVADRDKDDAVPSDYIVKELMEVLGLRHVLPEFPIKETDTGSSWFQADPDAEHKPHYLDPLTFGFLYGMMFQFVDITRDMFNDGDLEAPPTPAQQSLYDRLVHPGSVEIFPVIHGAANLSGRPDDTYIAFGADRRSD